MAKFSKAFKFITPSGAEIYPVTMRRGNLSSSPEMFRTSPKGGNILGKTEFEVDEATMIDQVLNLGHSVRMLSQNGIKNIYCPRENKVVILK